MAETAGSLSFGFEADFSGFTRAAEGAGQTLDRLARKAGDWGGSTSGSLARTLGGSTISSAQAALEAAARATPRGPGIVAPTGLSTAQVLAGATIKDTSGNNDDNSAKVLTHLSEQLALIKTVGTEHDAIVERMKIETEQAKLGSDATQGEKDAVAGLVKEIDAATIAQTKLKAAQDATNKAWNFGSQQVVSGIDALVFNGASLGGAAAGVLRNLSKAGLGAALTGSGPFAGLFGTMGSKGAEGGIFGAIGKSLFGGGGTVSSGTPSFAGLFAEGGSIGSGQWGIVGEKGAEVVSGPAAVTPWSKLPAGGGQGSTQVINFNVTSPDAPSFARSQTQMAAMLSRMVSRGQRNM